MNDAPFTPFRGSKPAWDNKGLLLRGAKKAYKYIRNQEDGSHSTCMGTGRGES